ncbi:nuclease [Sphingosinicella rhizophila]|uniref:Nuclease n=1 Tax=Sphingosinicella rhizophila TaxID=3050082 RepID=A0ABU3QAK1_9SPHN|nr:nuclease [Sphingosinicella sp. GR2756]MDT9600441.1 nuclease [Sphingosinicella sp. GR2756]
MSHRGALIGAALLAGVGLASPAAADPCTAPLPTREGHTFSGFVRYVGDGDSLCIGASADPRTWIEVRLADFDAPELHAALGARAKAALKAVALRRPAMCTAVRGRSGRVRVYDRVVALCSIEGRSIGTLLRQAGAPEGDR